MNSVWTPAEKQYILENDLTDEQFVKHFRKYKSSKVTLAGFRKLRQRLNKRGRKGRPKKGKNKE